MNDMDKTKYLVWVNNFHLNYSTIVLVHKRIWKYSEYFKNSHVGEREAQEVARQGNT
jgi:hypothetical protein